MPASRVLHLTAADVSLVLVQEDDQLPRIVHWGRAIMVDDDGMRAFAAADARVATAAESDAPYRPGILPEHARGWLGRPGLSLHRAGHDWAPVCRVERVDLDGTGLGADELRQTGPGVVRIVSRDPFAGIAVELEVELTPSGLVRVRSTVRNDADEPLSVEDVAPALPIPVRAREVLDFTGRWATEKVPQRHPIVAGTHSRTSRRGRTGLDATAVTAAGTPGFDAAGGEVWMCHVAFSGNHEHALERTDGLLAFRGAELLLPGEVILGPGEDYRTPWILGAHGIGLDAAAARFHEHVRATARAARRERPVTLNVWEAVYFDQDERTLTEIAERAAALGVERYVVDDGWFRGRRDDRRGLGDWTADPVVWPRGLRPLADRVRALGMEFGLWVEPEMINEDSDLARAHPDWILRARPELPPRSRHQQVLDLTRPEAFAHILDALDALVRDLDIAYLKWDHNRDLVAAGHSDSGTPAVHAQTLAVYALIDELRARHPELEIESCASGGGRVDLGILERTDRVHTSDNQDPMDRTRMLRWTGLLVPPEMLGSHVASPTSEVTGRTHDLHTRCAVAVLGHFGIEWDVRELDEDDERVLADWIAFHRRHRGLIQRGRVVGAGDEDASAPTVRGVVAQDGSEAIYTIVTPSLTADSTRRTTLPGLDPDRRYRLTVRQPASLGPSWVRPAWLTASPAELSGSVLGAVGLDVPTFLPERAIVVHLRAA